MFLFKHMNKMTQTGNNGRGPGGPRLPSDRRSDADDRCLLIRPVGSDAADIIDMFLNRQKFNRPLWLTVSSVCRQTTGTSRTYHGPVNS